MICSGTMVRWLKCIVCIFLAIFTSACALFYVRNSDGAILWTFRVRVSDHGSMAPVPDAEVSIIVKNEDSFGEFESFIREKEPKKCVTDPEGVCEITMEFNYYATEWLWKKHAYVNFRHRNIVVQAEAYQPLSEPLKRFIQTPYELTGEQSKKPSEITVSLKKKMQE